MAIDATREMTIEPAGWSAEAESWLSQALTTGTIESLRRQHEAGAVLFYIRCEGATVGAFLLRVDDTPRGPQGVIVAAAASMRGVDMVATCMPAIESRFVGVTSVRYHTAKPALARKLAALGYAAREIVCVKDLQV